MGVFRKKVERHRALVAQELSRAGYKIPVNLVLSLIQQESGGIIGRQAKLGAGDGSHAAGLMQVIASVTHDYNKAHSTNYEHVGDMTGKTLAHARLQIRVGLWTLAKQWKNVRKLIKNKTGELPPWEDVARIADTSYARGWGHTRKRLRLLHDAGEPLTWDALEANYPDPWDKTKNRPMHHSKKIWERFLRAEQEGPGGVEDVDIDTPPEAGDEDPEPTPENDEPTEEAKTEEQVIRPFAPPAMGTAEAVSVLVAALVVVSLVVVYWIRRSSS